MYAIRSYYDKIRLNYILIPLLVIITGSAASYFAQTGRIWYETINLPIWIWTPSNTMMEIAWTVIFILSVITSYSIHYTKLYEWEKYLADETSFGEEDWHIAAEKIEHQITPDQAETLAAQIGNPVFDPHGDPIPSAEGDLPAKKGNALNTLRVGEFARIIHIEDEPHAIYSQLVAAGLYPGMQVRMIELSKDRIKFLANGEEVVLAPLFAKNVTIAPIREETTVKGKFKSLSRNNFV